MIDINIENIVVSTQISQNMELDLSSLANVIPNSKYNPAEFPGLIIHSMEHKTAAFLLPDGKLLCTGARSMEEINETINRIHSQLADAGVRVNEKPEIHVENLIASSQLEKNVDLNSAARAMKSENVEYNPKQFPGLIYKTNDEQNTVILLFDSGKLICTGCRSEEELSAAVDKIRTNLVSLGML